jgi:hypothetical protein
MSLLCMCVCAHGLHRYTTSTNLRTQKCDGNGNCIGYNKTLPTDPCKTYRMNFVLSRIWKVY